MPTTRPSCAAESCAVWITPPRHRRCQPAAERGAAPPSQSWPPTRPCPRGRARAPPAGSASPTLSGGLVLPAGPQLRGPAAGRWRRNELTRPSGLLRGAPKRARPQSTCPAVMPAATSPSQGGPRPGPRRQNQSGTSSAGPGSGRCLRDTRSASRPRLQARPAGRIRTDLLVYHGRTTRQPRRRRWSRRCFPGGNPSSTSTSGSSACPARRRPRGAWL
mmetsp:Transcript_101519/g.287442  ORF Transcript_101519/g.287442 Transcript_101519/m.287442 type:complete len:218 (-) Transcript_101519:1219-1872(-)